MFLMRAFESFDHTVVSAIAMFRCLSCVVGVLVFLLHRQLLTGVHGVLSNDAARPWGSVSATAAAASATVLPAPPSRRVDSECHVP